jgi:IS605 OrfB family transposase
VEYAKKKKKPLVIEKLEFTKKRASLREQGSKLARKLSSFTYSSICTHIHAKANKEQVQVYAVNPAYTSQIGKVKFSHRYGLSIHHGAALAIGRRYLGFSERPNSGPGIIPDGKGGHVTLSLPVRNRDEHVWRFWSKLSKKIPAALTAHFRAAKMRSMSTLKTAHTMESPPEVKGETPLCESLEALLV